MNPVSRSSLERSEHRILGVCEENARESRPRSQTPDRGASGGAPSRRVRGASRVRSPGGIAAQRDTEQPVPGAARPFCGRCRRSKAGPASTRPGGRRDGPGGEARGTSTWRARTAFSCVVVTVDRHDYLAVEPNCLGSEEPATDQQACSYQEQQPGGGSDVNLLHGGAPSLSAGGKGGPSGPQSQSTATRCSTARNSGSSVTITASIRIAVATAKASA